MIAVSRETDLATTSSRTSRLPIKTTFCLYSVGKVNPTVVFDGQAYKSFDKLRVQSAALVSLFVAFRNVEREVFF